MKKVCLSSVFLISISVFSCSDPLENHQEIEPVHVEQEFIDEYEITDYWEVKAGHMSGEHDTSKYTIKFIPDADDSSTYIIENFAGNYNVEALLNADSILVAGQQFLNFDSTYSYVEGNGFIKEDSIFLSYFTGGSFGTVWGKCIGVGRKSQERDQ